MCAGDCAGENVPQSRCGPHLDARLGRQLARAAVYLYNQVRALRGNCSSLNRASLCIRDVTCMCSLDPEPEAAHLRMCNAIVAQKMGAPTPTAARLSPSELVRQRPVGSSVRGL